MEGGMKKEIAGERLFNRVGRSLRESCRKGEASLEWLRKAMPDYFFITMEGEGQALVNLSTGIHRLRRGRRTVLEDRKGGTVIAGLNDRGSFHEALGAYGYRGISYAELTQSRTTVPDKKRKLEVMRFEFHEPRPPVEGEGALSLDSRKEQEIKAAWQRMYPGDDPLHLGGDLELLLGSNRRYARISPPERIARILWLYRQGLAHDGLFLGIEEGPEVSSPGETRILFAVGNPPEHEFPAQVAEVFHRLGLRVHRAYCLLIHDGECPHFLGTFYVRTAGGRIVEKASPLFRKLKSELYNTQIVSTTSRPYGDFVLPGVMTGEEASLTNALIGFCYTTLAHNQPDRYHLSEVVSAFTANSEMTLRLCRLFRGRFDPDWRKGERSWRGMFKKAEDAVEAYNTGHRHLDDVRRAIYRAALLFIGHTLKTNFFVPEKHALVFRLDPSYLEELGEEFTGDLPPGRLFRVTFFSGRHGLGYHLGFADIARGGWRTVVSHDEDDFNENGETLFREVYVLAHTQHLKNKDIYEGGSKMVVLLDSSDAQSMVGRRRRLHKLQYGFANAFFDILAMKKGAKCHDRVLDYCGNQEVVELGPDENMDDAMIEIIARQAVKRGYLLGTGVISSKKSGINHRKYGVTALGVTTFAVEALGELGIDMTRDPFTLGMTGGPAGDVAGNTLRLLLEGCPRMKISLIIDGSGLLYDPAGADGKELKRLLLKEDIDGFRAEKIHPGGFLISRRRKKRVGLQELFLRIESREKGTRNLWITTDELHGDFENLLFGTRTDLFIPAGGRPETVDSSNWRRFFDGEGRPNCRAVVEGANSFFTSDARDALQKRGVVLIRDLSANKCGVIASSYEVIANLLMEESEFLENKEEYVADVMRILKRRAVDEARLIFERRRKSGGSPTWTGISEALSAEINENYGKLFEFLEGRPELLTRPAFRRVLLTHLPEFVGRHPAFRRRMGRLPLKYRCAMVACEIASRAVYGKGWAGDFEGRVTDFVRKAFPAP
jgi:glutamate dehydrogenase